MGSSAEVMTPLIIRGYRTKGVHRLAQALAAPRLDDLSYFCQPVLRLQFFANVTLALLNPGNPFPERASKDLRDAGISLPGVRY